MGEYHVTGGKPLRGTIRPGGAKNAVLPILAATVLNGGTSVIHNCPGISDTHLTVEILRALGCRVTLDGGTITVDSSGINNHNVPIDLVKRMRSSIIFMGSMLGRFGEVTISAPGGCELGVRSIDFHIRSMRQMGAVITDEEGVLVCSASGLTGQRVTFDTPSVGATENVMLAAVLAKGETIISNAAREPEITDLQDFLVSMGANVRGAGTGRIIVNGVKKLHDVEHTIIPDRIVAGTYLTAAAITGGEIILTDIIPEHIYPIYSRLAETGCHFKDENKQIHLRAPKRLKSLDRLTTLPHPGFPTDMQPQFTALLCLSHGSCVINETIFEARNKHIEELRRMGADITLLRSSPAMLIRGVKSLTGAKVEAKDLRGGAGLILAGLAAEGTTVIQNSVHVERGYDKIEDALSLLGADIRFIS